MVLQTIALPLGYAAFPKSFRDGKNVEEKHIYGLRQVKEKDLTKFDAFEPDTQSGEKPGFQARDLFRFFVVDCIIILSLRLLYQTSVLPSLDYYVVFTLMGKVALAAYLLWMVGQRIDGWRSAGGKSAGSGLGWLAGGVIVFAAMPVYAYLGTVNFDWVAGFYRSFGLVYQPAPQDVALIIFGGALHEWVRWLLVFFTLVAGPVMEEVAFRGIGVDAFPNRSGTAWAIVWTGLLFGLYHYDPVRVLPLAGLGMTLAAARALSRSLWCPIVLHVAYNGSVLLFMLRGTLGGQE